MRSPLPPLMAGFEIFPWAALGEDERAAFTLVLETLLSSAEFLYRIELDPDPESIFESEKQLQDILRIKPEMP
jgi:hypothetical protein